jgi:hypothetical protein
MSGPIDDVDLKIAASLTQIDEDLEQLALHIASGEQTEPGTDGDTLVGTGQGNADPPADFPIDVWQNGELDSGDLYMVSIYTNKKETQAKVNNKAGFADEENQKANADMAIQR